MITIRPAVFALAALLLTGCAPLLPQPQPLDAVLQSRATAGPLQAADAVVLGDNDAAFAAKLEAVERARGEVDLAYYIFSDDHSSSRLAQALIDAARRGVQVRLLVDYFSGYKQLDHLSWLEQQGGGRIEVRLYNRPTLPIVKDAAYLTLACSDVGVAKPPCDQQKIAAVDAHFAQPADVPPDNRSFAGFGGVPVRPVCQESEADGVCDRARAGRSIPAPWPPARRRATRTAPSSSSGWAS